MMTGCESLELTDVPRPREGLCCRSLDDEAVVYDPSHHILHYLNRTAYAIWQSCDGQRSVGQIAGSLAEAFDLDPAAPGRDAIIDDIRKTIADLAGSGLIELADACPNEPSNFYPCPT